jgi:hypothetical protein
MQHLPITIEVPKGNGHIDRINRIIIPLILQY